MKAEIIAEGTDVLPGKAFNLSTPYLSEQLSGLGVEVLYHSAVGNPREHLHAAVTTALSRSDLLVVAGGLGPPDHDLTREVVREALGIPSIFAQNEQTPVESCFCQGRPLPPATEKQARFPEGARVIPNPAGTAPGAFLVRAGKIILLLPGSPRELQPMFESSVRGHLEALLSARERVMVRTLKVFGLQETELATKASSVEARLKADPLTVSGVGALKCVLFDKQTHIDMRLTICGMKEQEAVSLLERAEACWREELGNRLFGRDDQTHAGVVGSLLRQTGLTLATAESCSGGLLGGRLTGVPGSSHYYLGGVIGYANETKKTFLGVNQESLEMYGAVSGPVAREMARGVRKALGSDLALATTGVAGPDGGTADKPVGLVYIALAHGTGEEVIACRFTGSRASVRAMTVETALDLLRCYLLSRTACQNSRK